MTLKISVCPPFLDEWTDVVFEGDCEDDLMNVLVSRLLACDYEVEIEVAGEMVSFEDYTQENENV